ncbi:hypothetical protein ACI68E_001263 [Malassezia pachydermatis]
MPGVTANFDVSVLPLIPSEGDITDLHGYLHGPLPLSPELGSRRSPHARYRREGSEDRLRSPTAQSTPRLPRQPRVANQHMKDAVPSSSTSSLYNYGMMRTESSPSLRGGTPVASPPSSTTHLPRERPLSPLRVASPVSTAREDSEGTPTSKPRMHRSRSVSLLSLRKLTGKTKTPEAKGKDSTQPTPKSSMDDGSVDEPSTPMRFFRRSRSRADLRSAAKNSEAPLPPQDLPRPPALERMAMPRSSSTDSLPYRSEYNARPSLPGRRPDVPMRPLDLSAASPDTSLTSIGDLSLSRIPPPPLFVPKPTTTSLSAVTASPVDVSPPTASMGTSGPISSPSVYTASSAPPSAPPVPVAEDVPSVAPEADQGTLSSPALPPLPNKSPVLPLPSPTPPSVNASSTSLVSAPTNTHTTSLSSSRPSSPLVPKPPVNRSPHNPFLQRVNDEPLSPDESHFQMEPTAWPTHSSAPTEAASVVATDDEKHLAVSDVDSRPISVQVDDAPSSAAHELSDAPPRASSSQGALSSSPSAAVPASSSASPSPMLRPPTAMTSETSPPLSGPRASSPWMRKEPSSYRVSTPTTMSAFHVEAPTTDSSKYTQQTLPDAFSMSIQPEQDGESPSFVLPALPSPSPPIPTQAWEAPSYTSDKAPTSPVPASAPVPAPAPAPAPAHAPTPSTWSSLPVPSTTSQSDPFFNLTATSSPPPSRAPMPRTATVGGPRQMSLTAAYDAAQRAKQMTPTKPGTSIQWSMPTSASGSSARGPSTPHTPLSGLGLHNAAPSSAPLGLAASDAHAASSTEPWSVPPPSNSTGVPSLSFVDDPSIATVLYDSDSIDTRHATPSVGDTPVQPAVSTRMPSSYKSAPPTSAALRAPSAAASGPFDAISMSPEQKRVSMLAEIEDMLQAALNIASSPHDDTVSNKGPASYDDPFSLSFNGSQADASTLALPKVDVPSRLEQVYAQQATLRGSIESSRAEILSLRQKIKAFRTGLEDDPILHEEPIAPSVGTTSQLDSQRRLRESLASMDDLDRRLASMLAMHGTPISD